MVSGIGVVEKSGYDVGPFHSELEERFEIEVGLASVAGGGDLHYVCATGGGERQQGVVDFGAVVGEAESQLGCYLRDFAIEFHSAVAGYDDVVENLLYVEHLMGGDDNDAVV